MSKTIVWEGPGWYSRVIDLEGEHLTQLSSDLNDPPKSPPGWGYCTPQWYAHPPCGWKVFTVGEFGYLEEAK